MSRSLQPPPLPARLDIRLHAAPALSDQPSRRKPGRPLRLAPALCALLLSACAVARPPARSPDHSQDNFPKNAVSTAQSITSPYQADIRRTADGTAHVRAQDWGSLGYGFGYAQAQDNLCTLAESIVTFRGERSLSFGPQGHVAQRTTFGQPNNLDADVFFRLTFDRDTLTRYRTAQSPRGRELAQGFAAGINRYLQDLRAGADTGRHAACRKADWLRRLTREPNRVTEDDVYRRLYAATLAASAATQVAAIATAQPPSTGATATNQRSRAADDVASAERVPTPTTTPTLTSLNDAGLGSNAIAFGAALSADGQPILYGSPHWYWDGPDRLYPAHLTIPGQLDVAGVGMLGAPFIMIGFTRNVAWTHTVSTTRRFGLMALTLDPADPTRYRIDARTEAMQPVRIDVPVRDSDGRMRVASRTLYRTDDGPVVNLAAMSPALGWTTRQAMVLRDANAGNFGLLDHYLRMAQADSLDAFVRGVRADAANPWVNTVAIGRHDPRVWFGDIGPAPGVPDALAADCTAQPAGQAFARLAPGLPVLDGSRSACAWQTSPDSPLPGTLGRHEMPDLMSPTVVTNMNDSAWLAAPDAPLARLNPVLGRTDTPLSLRTRAGLQRIAALRAAGPVTAQAVRQTVLRADPLSADLARRSFLAQACPSDDTGNVARIEVQVANDPLDGKPLTPVQTVDIAPACRVLRAWDGTGERAARGANLWDAVWVRLAGADMTGGRAFTDPFVASQAATSPSQLAGERASLTQALGAAVLEMQRMGLALDSRRDEALFATRGGRRIGLAGGCDVAGYFSIMCADTRMGAGRYDMDKSPRGDTYIQVVTFPDTPSGAVDATTLDASGPADDRDDPRNAAALEAWAEKRWQAAPFSEADVAAATVSIVHLSQ
ncbi:penicillin acylase family protein [Pandoraea anhela]|uniref:Acyl-homoserine lactone acylase PvdQ n=1 Tax=Pandoraea anhela TaxID=2508295 RepID=A0A5E4WMN6_9BURK|nr:penicillin acylase family protein [Pandoraea anhela]VVE25403.1 Acyl-homoserine lactone acylase PvdQ [Pandoraea anhela]